MMKRRDFLKAVGLGAASLILPVCADGATQSSPQRKPNFVFILIDDMGFKDLGFMGGRYYETPNIDKLAGTMPEKAKELHRMLKEWRRSVNAPVPAEKNPQYDPAARAAGRPAARAKKKKVTK